MTDRCKNIEGIQWQHMDVRNMTGLGDSSIDVAFDKSTLDAMIHGSPWSPPDDVKANTSEYMKEVDTIHSQKVVFDF
jgi:EEF1A lysine methyltransferase 4